MGLSTNTVRWIIIGSATVWVILAVLVAWYGSTRGHPFFPLLICAILPFPGWPLVLLAAAVVPRQPRRRNLGAPDDYEPDYESAPAPRPGDVTDETRPFPPVAPPRRRQPR